MRKIFLSILLLIGMLFVKPLEVSADFLVSDASAQIKRAARVGNDTRVTTLRKYLASHSSPLVDYADEFVATADKYDLDWRLVPAISGVESTFGKNIPKNSYNAYGWANGDFNFASWEDSIEVVSKALRTKYIDRGAPSINKIARRYAPPSSSWAWKVKFFMSKIEPMPIGFDLEG
jgi:hypothetical protein